MQIQELKLLNYRNFKKIDVTFYDNLNVIFGKNGSGKTNLVEAIYVLALSRSFKQINDKSLILKGENLTKIEGILNNNYQTNYKVIITDEGKKVLINNNRVTKISDYISKLNIVLFNPNDLRMIKDTPSIRRRYLNISISQMDVLYLKNLNDYNKLLKIRNSYLKQMMLNGNLNKDYLNIVTEKLVDIGLKLVSVREEFIKKMNQLMASFYDKIAQSGSLELEYKSDYKNKNREELLSLYKKNLEKDMSFGKTTMGPHHDDIKFLLDKMNLKDYGSEGQQKNTVISWKFSEIAFIKEKLGVTPILILDDLLSELDIEKIKNIFELIENDIQTFITTTEIEKLDFLLKKHNSKKFLVESGSIREVRN